jgi:hypothetical protein
MSRLPTAEVLEMQNIVLRGQIVEELRRRAAAAETPELREKWEACVPLAEAMPV